MTNVHKNRQNQIQGWAALHPCGIVTFGAPNQPEERLIGVQTAIYRTFVWLGRLRTTRLRYADAAKGAHDQNPARSM